MVNVFEEKTEAELGIPHHQLKISTIAYGVVILEMVERWGDALDWHTTKPANNNTHIT